MIKPKKNAYISNHSIRDFFTVLVVIEITLTIFVLCLFYFFIQTIFIFVLQAAGLEQL